MIVKVVLVVAGLNCECVNIVLVVSTFTVLIAGLGLWGGGGGDAFLTSTFSQRPNLTDVSILGTGKRGRGLGEILRSGRY